MGSSRAESWKKIQFILGCSFHHICASNAFQKILQYKDSFFLQSGASWPWCPCVCFYVSFQGLLLPTLIFAMFAFELGALPCVIFCYWKSKNKRFQGPFFYSVLEEDGGIGWPWPLLPSPVPLHYSSSGPQKNDSIFGKWTFRQSVVYLHSYLSFIQFFSKLLRGQMINWQHVNREMMLMLKDQDCEDDHVEAMLVSDL